MKIKIAEFVTSADKLANCPNLNTPEIALIGRSNVGKSSFINAICNRKSLAKTSNTPGKTRLINFFNINNEFALVDLPGYGYAKVSKQEQNKWKKTLEEYLLEREPLIGVIQFIDSRHDVQNNDIAMREWLDYNNIPVVTIATKVDTLPKNKVIKSINNIAKTLNSKVYSFSSKSGIGKNEILNLLQDFNA